MSSPFPGMNPFLEGQEWEDFHATFNTVLRETLSPRIRPKYVARVERRIYVERPSSEDDQYLVADSAIVLTGERGGLAVAEAPAATASVEGLVAIAEQHRETYLVIRHVETQEVVTVIETLSPANKRRGGDGRREYLNKRQLVLRSHSSLVEIDLLRGGVRLPMMSPLPDGDYYAIVTRAWTRPRSSICAWTLRDPLPTIAIPLRQEDGDVTLNLQQVFATVCERADYELTLDYRRRLSPPPKPAEEEWLKSLALPIRVSQPPQ